MLVCETGRELVRETGRELVRETGREEWLAVFLVDGSEVQVKDVDGKMEISRGLSVGWTACMLVPCQLRCWSSLYTAA